MTTAEFNLLKIDVRPIEGTNDHVITISGYDFRICPFHDVDPDQDGYNIYIGETYDECIDEYLGDIIDFDDPDYNQSYGFRSLVEFLFENHV